MSSSRLMGVIRAAAEGGISRRSRRRAAPRAARCRRVLRSLQITNGSWHTRPGANRSWRTLEWRHRPPRHSGIAAHTGCESAESLDRHASTDRSLTTSILYFFFNLSLTLYNKIALVSFPFPWTLTCIHSLCASIGSYTCYRRGYFKRTVNINRRDHLTLVAYSSLYTINIAVSNLSLNLVSVPTHQVVRSTTPLFTILISIVLYKKTYLREIYLSLIPVILGVCLATWVADLC